MQEKECKTCQYFFQHYCLNKEKFYRVYCGHCTFSRVKKKRPDDRACENFVPGLTNTDAFVTKEFLSIKLLQYVFDLQLLPEIEELPKSSKWTSSADGKGD